jgi:hypothetical protein
MPDMERAEQILAIARVLARMPTGNKSRPYMGTPAPIRAVWATELYDDFGVRVHEDLAKKELVRVPSPLGNNGPVQAVTKGAQPVTPNGDGMERMRSAHVLMMDWLHVNNPELAAEVEAAQNDPTLAAIVLNKIRTDYPAVWDKGQELLASIPEGGQ